MRPATAATAFADWLTARTTRTSPGRRSTACGRRCSAAASSSRSTTCATPTRRRTRSCSTGSPPTSSQHGYDIRHTLRLIAPERDLRPQRGRRRRRTEADDRFYSHAYRRPLEPEVLADAIARRDRRVASSYGDEPAGHAGRSRCSIRGRPRRRSTSSAAARARRRARSDAAGGGLPAKLHLLNGELINRKIAARDGRLHRLIAAGNRPTRDRGRVLPPRLRPSRRPRRSDVTGRRMRRRSTTRTAAAWLEDFVWSLLNSREFTTNH